MREVAFIKKNKDKWRSFELAILGKVKKNPDELAGLYIHLANDLSFARTYYPKSKTVIYLNHLAVTDMVYGALSDYFGAAGMTYGAPIAYRWRCIACGPRQIQTSTKALRFVAGMEGTLGSWDYDFALSRATSRSESVLGNGYYYTPHLKQILGSGLLNPFLMPGQDQ